MVRLTIIETGDKVQIDETKAAIYKVSNGDEISLARWHEIISSDLHDVIMNYAEDQNNLSDAQKTISRLWSELGRTIGIEVEYSDLLHAIIKPEASDDAVVLLADYFLTIRTSLIGNIELVFPAKRYEAYARNHRQWFIDYIADMDKQTKKLFRSKLEQTLKNQEQCTER
jgi:hypothetical protein